MTNKQLKNLAKEIAKLELKMQKTEDIQERANIEAEMTKLASGLDLNDLIFLDHCIQKKLLD
jgi:hypothetical protein